MMFKSEIPGLPPEPSDHEIDEPNSEVYEQKIKDTSGFQHGLECLDSGLLLEKQKILLPWGTRFIHLARWAAPDHLVRSIAWNELHWKNPILLHGLKAQHLQVVLFPYGWLDSILVWMIKSHSDVLAGKAFDRAYKQITKYVGEPVNGLIRPEKGSTCLNVEELARWEAGRVSLTLVMREAEAHENFTHGTFLHIACCLPCGLPVSEGEKRAGWEEAAEA
jgi:hypothetical protein